MQRFFLVALVALFGGLCGPCLYGMQPLCIKDLIIHSPREELVAATKKFPPKKEFVFDFLHIHQEMVLQHCAEIEIDAYTINDDHDIQKLLEYFGVVFKELFEQCKHQHVVYLYRFEIYRDDVGAK